MMCATASTHGLGHIIYMFEPFQISFSVDITIIVLVKANVDIKKNNKILVAKSN